MAFSERLKEARINAGLTQEQLANELGMAKSTIAGYEKGNREPNMLTIKNLMEILNIDANFLWQDEMNDSLELIVSSYEWNIIKKYRELDSYGVRVVDSVLNIEHDRCTRDQEEVYETVMKPSFQACLSAGTGQFVFDDIPSELIEVPAEYKDIDFVIGVSGDSMEPTYYDGDKVMIKKQEVRIGQIGAFMINGVALLKELGKDRLISHNKEYDDLLFNEFMKIDCIGKVVGKLN